MDKKVIILIVGFVLCVSVSISLILYNTKAQPENGEGIRGEVLLQPNSEKYCYRYANAPMRTLFYKAKNGDCSPKWGWGHDDINLQNENGQGTGGEVWASQQPNTEKYCYRYANDPMRTLFYKAKNGDCSPKWGWGYDDINLQNENGQGTGGEVWFYASEQPNTEKYCYRYANAPMRTLFYKAKNGDCSPKWGWGHDDINLQNENGQGTGGEVWINKS